MILFNKNHPVLSDTNAIQIWDAFEKCEVFFFIGDTAVFILSHWWNKDITLNHPKSGLLYSIEPHSSCKSDHFDLDNIYSSYWSFPINTQKISFNGTDNINCTVEGRNQFQ